ncbi:MAG TPA: STT3 domain-containing protein [Anaeromyxobacteraceae bacterium]|nr:STT3 domain-containing protein [Anaeromyxobacteraceae bacterium]
MNDGSRPGASASPSAPRRTPSGGALATLALILVVGAVARLLHWKQVFSARGVRFVVDSDPLYHVLQAERLLRDGWRATWFDPSLNWPYGAKVPWPPLFDYLIAGAARVFYGAALGRGEIERAGAVLPVVLGILTLLLVAALGFAILGRGRGLGPAFFVAVVEVHVAISEIGRPDQHVMEVLISCWILLAFFLSFQGKERGYRLAATCLMAVGLALGAWNWVGSPFNALFPVAFGLLAHVLFGGAGAQRVACGLFWGFGGGAALLAASIACLGHPGALSDGTLAGLSAVPVVIMACAAVFGGTLLATRRVPGRSSFLRRSIEAGVALIAAAATAFVYPPVRIGIAYGLTALSVGDAWFKGITEFRPLLFSCLTPLHGDLIFAFVNYGLLLPAAIFAIPSLAKRWRADRAERLSVLFLAVWAASYFVLALLRRRFGPYFVIPLAIVAWEGLAFASQAIGRRLFPTRSSAHRVLFAAGVVLAALPNVYGLTRAETQVSESWVGAMSWLRTQPSFPGREGVLGSWVLGHVILYYAGKPVVVGPFGSDAGGKDALAYAAAFNFNSDIAIAQASLADRRIGYVVMYDPRWGAFMDGAIASPGNRVVLEQCSLGQGVSWLYADSFWERCAPRLFYWDGMARPGRNGDPLDRVRLLYETPSADDQVKIFGVVEGAQVVITGVPSSIPVLATAEIQSNQGRPFTWARLARVNADGMLEVRLPYATGRNGTVEASPWTIYAGDALPPAKLVISESDVLFGSRRTVDLHP